MYLLIWGVVYLCSCVVVKLWSYEYEDCRCHVCMELWICGFVELLSCGVVVLWKYGVVDMLSV